MPASIFQGMVEVMLQGFLKVVCYFIGGLVISVISFGHWKCDPIMTAVPRWKLLGIGYYHRRGQQLYLTAEATHLVGLPTL